LKAAVTVPSGREGRKKRIFFCGKNKLNSWFMRIGVG
jgi:hypothetical protein